jgi:hypothetical protein
LVEGYTDISKLVANNNNLAGDDVEVLQNLVAQMPWCSAYRVVLAKAYHSQNSFQKNKHLRLAATYIGQREQLFSYIHEVPTVSNTASVQVKEPLEEVDVAQEVALEEEVVTQEVVLEEDTQNVTSESPELAETEEESVVDTPSNELAPSTDKEESVLEVLASESTSNKVDAEEKEEDPVSETEEIITETEEPAEPKGNKIDFDKVVKYDPLTELPKIDPPKERDRTELSFDYVAYNPEKELNKLIEDKENLKEDSENDFLFWLNTIGDEENPKDSKPKDKSPDTVQRLLDQFLATKTTRRIRPAEFYSASNRAEESEHDKMDVISETLVELYAKQGHLEKAVAGFEKLSLQNPEKSAYFAARIKELENKI